MRLGHEAGAQVARLGREVFFRQGGQRVPGVEDWIVPLLGTLEIELPAEHHLRVQVACVGEQHKLGGGRLGARLMGGQHVLGGSGLGGLHHFLVLGPHEVGQLLLAGL